tara:strand:+ start:11902 stop:12984 length:1083 start_codon:yes stop_codon:yes gene_type:complete
MNAKIKIVTVIGARPQFIKAASLSREIKKHKAINEVIIHTGQHFDENMSDIFFQEMKIPKPNYKLNINSLSHGEMTGLMIKEIEKILINEKPNWLLVYGDTNSTLAGALAAKKLHIKLIHVEAGLRSFNMNMPEEINRILTDRISDILFCPSQDAITNLKNEGFDNFGVEIFNVGDIMYDSAKLFSKSAKKSKIVTPKNYILATIHRQENTDISQNLINIFDSLDKINSKINIVMPIHPRTKNFLLKYNIKTKIKLIEPAGYIDMLDLIKGSKAVITDSGGLQKEAYFFKKQCFTFRDQTEWVELIKNGYNTLVDVTNKNIEQLILKKISKKINFDKQIYGDGKTSKKIISKIQELHTSN